MNPAAAAIITSISLSLLTVTVTILLSNRTAKLTELESLADRVRDLEKKLGECERRSADLLRENILLMRQLTLNGITAYNKSRRHDPPTPRLRRTDLRTPPPDPPEEDPEDEPTAA